MLLSSIFSKKKIYGYLQIGHVSNLPWSFLKNYAPILKISINTQNLTDCFLEQIISDILQSRKKFVILNISLVQISLFF